MGWNLDGRVPLIAGGASGIGAELARQLADGLGRAMRVELAPDGVTVGTAHCLFLATPTVAAGDRTPIFNSAKDRLPSR